MFRLALVPGLALAPVTATAGLVVDEAAVRVAFDVDPAVVSLPVRNDAGAPLAAGIDVEWLDRRDEVLGVARRELTLAPGESSVDVSIRPDIAKLSAGDLAELRWSRIRYRLAATTPGGPPPMAGVVAARPAGIGGIALANRGRHNFCVIQMQ